MSNLGPFRRACYLFVAAILACGIAAADTIVVTGTGLGDNNFYLKENGTDTEVYFAGIIDITLDGNYKRTSMCVQLFVNINENTTYNSTVLTPEEVAMTPPPTVAALEQIAWLLDSNNGSPASTNDQAAGLQLAIWKIAEDGVYTGGANPFTTGTVQEATGNHTTPTAILTDAQTYLTAAVGQWSNSAFVYENVTTGSPPTAVQMLEGWEYSGGPQPVAPESSTFILAGAALLALGRTARRNLGRRS